MSIQFRDRPSATFRVGDRVSVRDAESRHVGRAGRVLAGGAQVGHGEPLVTVHFDGDAHGYEESWFYESQLDFQSVVDKLARLA